MAFDEKIAQLLTRLAYHHLDNLHHFYLPGTWSTTLFLEDIKGELPSDDDLAQSLISPPNSYLEWYEGLFQKPHYRVNNEFTREVWHLFDRAPLNLHFENLFQRLITITKPNDNDRELLNRLSELSKVKVSAYNETVKRWGFDSLIQFRDSMTK
jgi:hypothetical protein